MSKPICGQHTATNDLCRKCPASNSGPCRWFGETLRSRIVAASSLHRFGRGAVIAEQGTIPSRIGVVLSGLVKIATIDDDGNEHILQLLHQGDLIGDPFGDPVSFSLEAATDVELCLAPRATLATMFQGQSEAYAAYLRIALSQQLEQHFAQLSMRGRNSLQRVAYWIWSQLGPHAEDDSAPVRVRILLSRRDLASLLEMSVETLCRCLHQLQDQRAIRLATPETLELVDKARLANLARGQDGQLRDIIQKRGWEWGAKLYRKPSQVTTAPALRQNAFRPEIRNTTA